MAYYDRSIERIQSLIESMEEQARMFRVSGSVAETRMAARIREGKSLLVEVRDEMIISNYNRGRSSR